MAAAWRAIESPSSSWSQSAVERARVLELAEGERGGVAHGADVVLERGAQRGDRAVAVLGPAEPRAAAACSRTRGSGVLEVAQGGVGGDLARGQHGGARGLGGPS